MTVVEETLAAELGHDLTRTAGREVYACGFHRDVEVVELEPGGIGSLADVGLGVYLTMTGSTVREHGLILGDHLFSTETVLMENIAESGELSGVVRVREALATVGHETEIAV